MQKNYKNKFEKYFKKKFGQKNWKGGGVKQIWSLFRDRHTHTSPLYIDHHHHHHHHHHYHYYNSNNGFVSNGKPYQVIH